MAETFDRRDHRYSVTKPKAPEWQPHWVCACGWRSTALGTYMVRDEYRAHINACILEALGILTGPSPEEAIR